jgi:hypothetical protein
MRRLDEHVLNLSLVLCGILGVRMQWGIYG